MRYRLRLLLDKTFTFVAWLTVLSLVLMLLIVMLPIFNKGISAVVFRATHDFRKLQNDRHGRGDPAAVKAEQDSVWALRNEVFKRVADFRASIDTDVSKERVSETFRRVNEQLKEGNAERSTYLSLRVKNGRIRDKIVAAASASPEEADNLLTEAAELLDDQAFSLAASAKEYQDIIEDIQSAQSDLAADERRGYLEGVAQIEEILRAMFGPTPDEVPPTMVMYRYGMTRWDMALSRLNELLHVETWEALIPGAPLQRVVTRRETMFEGTNLQPLFGYVEQNFEKLFNPRLTFYFQYFFDDSTSGKFFGGVGPEIIGTLLLVFTSMLIVVPLGIISAAYLTECVTEGLTVRIVRMGINVLAGVPSIVFGLFGMAFFMLFLFPAIGLPSRPSVLAGALTLSLLTLPVMIRSSEEAIKAVPKAYKEAALALGASGFRTFVAVTLPAALPGILTGVILSLSRVAGETAPILFTTAVALGPIPGSILEPTRTLSYGTYDMAVGDRIAMSVPHQQFGMVMTLILIVTVLNAVSIGLRTHFFRKLQGR